MKTAVHSIAAILLMTLFIALPAQSAEKAGVELPDSRVIGNSQLQLNGMALREKFVFDVYVAALYLQETTTDADAILKANNPRLMVMHFVRGVDAGRINGAWYEGLEANAQNPSRELTAKFDRLAGMMEDIAEGETMELAYEPSSGTRIIVRGKDKGIIPGKDFADAILATWIGPHPGPGAAFKDDLLNR